MKYINSGTPIIAVCYLHTYRLNNVYYTIDQYQRTTTTKRIDEGHDYLFKLDWSIIKELLKSLSGMFDMSFIGIDTLPVFCIRSNSSRENWFAIVEKSQIHEE